MILALLILAATLLIAFLVVICLALFAADVWGGNEPTHEMEHGDPEARRAWLDTLTDTGRRREGADRN